MKLVGASLGQSLPGARYLTSTDRQTKNRIGWRLPIAQAWHARNLPNLVSAALTVAILWEIGATVQRMVAPRSAAAATAATSPKHTRRTGPRDAFDIQGLVNAHLFGIAGLAQDTVAAETREPLFLHGTLATAEPDKGLAIVGSAETSGILYHVGADMPGGLQLRQVFVDHIVMARGGALESLYLPKSTLAAEPASDRPPSAAARPEVPSGGAILRILNLRAAPRGSRGMRVYGTNAAALAALGFAPGDVIHEINGVSMDEPNPESGSIDIAQKISQGESLSMIVERQGARTAVTLNAARAADVSRESNSL